MRDELCLRYERMNIDSDDDEDAEETALTTKGKFSGECFNCGKKGHHIADCNALKKKSGNGEGKFNGKCYNGEWIKGQM